MELRDYQKKAVEAVEAGWETRRKQLLVLPTGTGKTIVFAELIRREVGRGNRVLVLAHREELLSQAADKIGRMTGLECAVEKASQRGVNTLERVVLGSVQTLARKERREAYPQGEFGLIVVDEAHHAISASYMEILNYFTARVLGVTATADRGDKRNLGEYFEAIAYEYTLYDAVREGWLVRPVARTIPLKLDLTGVSMSAGDYAAGQLGSTLTPYLGEIAKCIIEAAPERKTVIFLPLIDTSKQMMGILQSNGVECREVNGQSEDRAETLRWFHDAGPGAMLCNSMLLTEGWDEPSTDCIVCLRPTKIRSLYAQIVGRGTRLAPGKKNLLILDFLWLTGRHNLIRPAYLFAKGDDPEMMEKVAQMELEQSQEEEIDLLETGEENAGKVRREREEALRKELEEQRRQKARLVDPLQFVSSIRGAVAEWEPNPNDIASLAPPTKKQLERIERAGINPEGIKYMGHASMILDTLQTRWICGLSTPKQIRLLERKGFRNVGQWKFEEANKAISLIAQNNWIVPHGVMPRLFVPPSLREKEAK